ncbi:MAG TPA: hypothetical protein VKQ89_02485 [Candidatus Angelobacter sp.]|nr:hypothetical protein [Candidatus Angelobacter sp.]
MPRHQKKFPAQESSRTLIKTPGTSRAEQVCGTGWLTVLAMAAQLVLSDTEPEPRELWTQFKIQIIGIARGYFAPLFSGRLNRRKRLNFTFLLPIFTVF